MKYPNFKMPMSSWRNARAFFVVLGPGLITANADNDASGVFGYSLAGAAFQYRMLWVLVASTFALAVAQEMCARMGAVTGKGLADLIRERFGVKIAFWAMIALLIANFATTVSEFAGILAAITLYLPPYSRFFVLPITAMVIWALVTKGTYHVVERVLLSASRVYLLYIGSAFLAKPDWGQVFHETLFPHTGTVSDLGPYVFMIINVVGTTITPWGQFYLQASIRDKGIGPEEYPFTRLDVFFGALFTNLIAFFIVVCCGATLYTAGIHELRDAGEAAQALLPLAGPMATALFAIGLFNASCFGAIAVPLSTAYAISESLGWESGVGRRSTEAPLFVGVFSFLLFASVLVVMLFPQHLTLLIILPNIVGGVLLPIILVLMLLLVNDRGIMGEWINNRLQNVVGWGTTAIIATLSVLLLVTSV